MFEVGSQPKITPLPAGWRRCDGRRSEVVAQLVCWLMETHLPPLGAVEELVRASCHRELLWREKKTLGEERMLARPDQLALSTDCWTALTNESECERFSLLMSHFAKYRLAAASQIWGFTAFLCLKYSFIKYCGFHAVGRNLKIWLWGILTSIFYYFLTCYWPKDESVIAQALFRHS